MDVCAGDKVMQIENDYDKEVYNDDIGYIVDVDPEAGELVASFEVFYCRPGSRPAEGPQCWRRHR
jgi:ATP-dependent exoDNAse (exonuclease V) alpha subunit